jgi:Na+-transporting NADH:ubiquinone oxidoreductase subunit NqrA
LLKKNIAFLFLIVFFLPSGIEILHALENHTHQVCHSKTENHVHENNTECDFHFFKVNTPYLPNTTHTYITPIKKTVLIDGSYNFLLDYQPLSYRQEAHLLASINLLI